MQLTIEAKNVQDLKQGVLELAKMFEGTATESIQTEPVVPEQETAKRTRKAKTEKPETVEAPTSAAPPPESEITSQTVAKALQEVNSKKGIDAARSVLNTFGCARLSEVKSEDYSRFVEACREAVA